jgi:hypothetical protein
MGERWRAYLLGALVSPARFSNPCWTGVAVDVEEFCSSRRQHTWPSPSPSPPPRPSSRARVPSGQASREAGQRRSPGMQNRCRGHPVRERRSSWTYAWLTDVMPHICVLMCLNPGLARGSWWFGWEGEKIEGEVDSREAEGIELKLVKSGTSESASKLLAVERGRGGACLSTLAGRWHSRQLMTGFSSHCGLRCPAPLS